MYGGSSATVRILRCDYAPTPRADLNEVRRWHYWLRKWITTRIAVQALVLDYRNLAANGTSAFLGRPWGWSGAGATGSRHPQYRVFSPNAGCCGKRLLPRLLLNLARAR